MEVFHQAKETDMTSITMGLLERAAEATARATDLALRFGAWRGERRQRLARRARFRHLLHLDDRILDDIGLERGTLQIGRASCRERVCQYV